MLTKRRLEGFELQVTSVLDFDASDDTIKLDGNVVTSKIDDTKDCAQIESTVNTEVVNKSSKIDKDLNNKEDCDNSLRDNASLVVKDNVDTCDKSKDINSNDEKGACKDVKADEDETDEALISTLERSRTLSKRRSVYDSASDDVAAGISELEQSVCQLISNVGNSIGNGLIEEETEEELKKDSRRGSADSDSSVGVSALCSPEDVEEDADDTTGPRRTAQVLSPVVEMICDTLAELTPTLSRLVLAIDLDADQVRSVVRIVFPLIRN